MCVEKAIVAYEVMCWCRETPLLLLYYVRGENWPRATETVASLRAGIYKRVCYFSKCKTMKCICERLILMITKLFSHQNQHVQICMKYEQSEDVMKHGL